MPSAGCMLALEIVGLGLRMPLVEVEDVLVMRLVLLHFVFPSARTRIMIGRLTPCILLKVVISVEILPLVLIH